MKQIYTDKSAARSALLQMRDGLSAESMSAQSHMLSKQLLATAQIRNADTVLLFSSTRNEPDLSAVARHLLEYGICVAYPISNKDSYTLTFRTVSSPSELTPATFNIPEPPASAPIPVLTAASVCVVPALAYDKEGYRLGYGKGFYDRFLSNFIGTSIGVAYDGFLLDHLPHDAHDIPLDMIITTTGAIKTR